MNTFVIVLLVIVGLLALLVIFSRMKMKNLSDVETHAEILTLSDANFAHQLKGKVVMVDFWADWCMPCKMMAPILNEVADELKEDRNRKIAKLDVDKNQATAQKYGIRSIPTLVIFNDGKEVSRIVGVKNKRFLLDELRKI
ncbi:MAG: thioredoxin [Paludibacteraceae bacterium]